MNNEISSAMKESIDAMSLESMLYNWRFSPVGSPLFKGDTGKYYAERMSMLKKLVGEHGCPLGDQTKGCDGCAQRYECLTSEHKPVEYFSDISKRVGWDR